MKHILLLSLCIISSMFTSAIMPMSANNASSKKEMNGYTTPVKQQNMEVSNKRTTLVMQRTDSTDTIARPYDLTTYVQNRGAGFTWRGTMPKYNLQVFLGTDTILSVTTTTRTYTVGNLADGDYVWRVRCGNYDETKFSEWTYSDFRIIGTDAVTLTSLIKPTIYGSHGMIYFDNAEGMTLNIYDVTGRIIVENHLLETEREQVPLKTGIYIVRLNGNMQKVMVK